MSALNLNYLPIKVRVEKQGYCTNKIVARVGKRKLTQEDVSKLSIKLERMGISHLVRSNMILLSNEIEIIEIKTKQELAALTRSQKNKKKEDEIKRDILKFSPAIQKFINNNFTCSNYGKKQISLLLNGEIKPYEVSLQWGFSSFEDVINNFEIDTTNLRDVYELWNAIYEAFLTSKDKGIL